MDRAGLGNLLDYRKAQRGKQLVQHFDNGGEAGGVNRGTYGDGPTTSRDSTGDPRNEPTLNGPMVSTAHDSSITNTENSNRASAAQRAVDALTGSGRGSVVEDAGARKAYYEANPVNFSVDPAQQDKYRNVSADVRNAYNQMFKQEGGINLKTGEFKTSKQGATGPGQIMPDTAPTAAKYAGVPFDATRFATDPVYNYNLGLAYYDHLVKTYDGDMVKAAAAYNAGPGNVAKAEAKAVAAGGVYTDFMPKETKKYVDQFAKGLSAQTETPVFDPLKTLSDLGKGIVTGIGTGIGTLASTLTGGAIPMPPTRPTDLAPVASNVPMPPTRPTDLTPSQGITSINRSPSVGEVPTTTTSTTPAPEPNIFEKGLTSATNAVKDIFTPGGMVTAGLSATPLAVPATIYNAGTGLVNLVTGSEIPSTTKMVNDALNKPSTAVASVPSTDTAVPTNTQTAALEPSLLEKIFGITPVPNNGTTIYPTNGSQDVGIASLAPSTGTSNTYAYNNPYTVQSVAPVAFNYAAFGLQQPTSTIDYSKPFDPTKFGIA